MIIFSDFLTQPRAKWPEPPKAHESAGDEMALSARPCGLAASTTSCVGHPNTQPVPFQRLGRVLNES